MLFWWLFDITWWRLQDSIPSCACWECCDSYRAVVGPSMLFWYLRVPFHTLWWWAYTADTDIELEHADVCFFFHLHLDTLLNRYNNKKWNQNLESNYFYIFMCPVAVPILLLLSFSTWLEVATFSYWLVLVGSRSSRGLVYASPSLRPPLKGNIVFCLTVRACVIHSCREGDLHSRQPRSRLRQGT